MDIISADMRTTNAKAKQLRRSGIIPCVIYGSGLKESLSIQIDQSTAQQLKRMKRNGSMADIRVGGETYHTLIKDLEYNNLLDEVVHISFLMLETGKKVNSVADIVLLNKDKVQGILEQIQMQIPHAAEPEYLLDTVAIDLDGRPAGTVILVEDIPEFMSDQIELRTDPGSIVLRINDKKRADARPMRVAE